MGITNREDKLGTLRGRTLGRYEITAFLGAGGMGEVYRARDTQLGRDVALKILPESFASEPERLRRFEDEARAVARLSHPNILTIHDFGTEAGITFAVMELLEGESLRSRLQRGPLSVRKAIDVASQIADALSAAHHGGVVHRDIKPENVFLVPGGQVKILDFGIAHLREEVSGASRTLDSEETITDDIRAAGTLAYMSPEQLRGQRVGPASDIFSLGCVLYEMLTDRRPFQRQNSADTVSAILHHDPPPITDRRPEAPPVLAHLVTRCLEKQPDERFESARDLAFALRDVSTTDPSSPRFQGPADRRRLRTRRLVSAAVATALIAAAAALAWRLWFAPPPPLPEEKHLAVLPLVASQNDPPITAIAEGLTVVIFENLAHLEQIENGVGWTVREHDLVTHTDGSLTSVRQVFNPTILITGRLERTGNRLRLTLSAVDPKHNRELASATIDEPLGNVDAFQIRPLVEVANMLRIELPDRMVEAVSRAGTTVSGAFHEYVVGRGLLSSLNGEVDVDLAMERFRSALEQDPLFPAARTSLTKALLEKFTQTMDSEWLELAFTHAQRLLDREPRTASTSLVVGLLHRAAGDEQAEITALEQAAHYAPDDPEVRVALGSAYRHLKRSREAESEFRKSIFLRGTYWPDYDRMAKLYFDQGMLEAAAIEFQHAIDCAPEFALGYVKLGGVNMYLGRPATARAMFERSIEIEPTFAALSNLGSLHFEASRFSDAADMFERAIELEPESHVLWGNLGYAYRYAVVEPTKTESAFRRAISLSEARLQDAPDDLQLAILTAGYHAMVDERERGLELLESVTAADPTSPILLWQIAETFEDLDERARALEWVDRSFAAGVSRDRFEGRPTLRELVADPRYQILVSEHFLNHVPGDGTSEGGKT